MSDDKIIADLTRENQRLRAQVIDMIEEIGAAKLRMVCIGGPLNDNKNGYTPTQIKEWQSVFNCLSEWENGS